MLSSFTSAGWMLCGVAVFLILFAVYAHVEGNRVTTTRFVFEDIRRDMTHRPVHKVWWRAFTIAMGWRKRGHLGQHRHATRHSNITFITDARTRR